MNDWQRLDELLERGLDFYGRQLVSEAIQCWREVLYLSPGHRLALEYLEAAGASADEDFEPPPVKSRSRTSASMPVASEPQAPAAEEPPLTLESLSVLAVELIRERRLEEALALLYTAHGEAPKDQAISRSINVIKQKLTREYRAEIGDLGQIPHLTVDEALIDELDLLDEEREVLRLVDGIVALDDVVQTAGLGALQIYRVLAQLLRRNLIVMKAPSPVSEPVKAKRVVEDSPRTKTAPFRPVLVPPAPPEPAAAATGPKLVSLPPVPEPPKPVVAAAPVPAPVPITSAAPTVAPAPASAVTPAMATGTAPAPNTTATTVTATTTTMPRAPSVAKIATSTALPVPTTPALPPQPAKAGAVATSVTSVIAASAAASSGVPVGPLDAAGSGAFAALLSAVGKVEASGAIAVSGGVNVDSPPRRPSPYASHVAEAVRAHLQGNHLRAKELLALCIAECPDDPAAKRNLQRLKERLGVKEER